MRRLFAGACHLGDHDLAVDRERQCQPHADIVERFALDVEANILRQDVRRAMQFMRQVEFQPANLLWRHRVAHQVELAATEPLQGGG